MLLVTVFALCLSCSTSQGAKSDVTNHPSPLAVKSRGDTFHRVTLE